MAACSGLADDHCCHLGAAGVCRFLEENTVEGRRWACRLRRELGSWEKVHGSDRYRKQVRPLLDACGVAQDCGDWPPLGETCGTCGVTCG
jgi:hypothetical protein